MLMRASAIFVAAMLVALPASDRCEVNGWLIFRPAVRLWRSRGRRVFREASDLRCRPWLTK